MNILALDPAATTGWAHYPSGEHGTWHLNEHARLSDFYERLVAIHKRLGPFTKIAQEDASFGSHNPHTQLRHNELRGVIGLVAQQLGIPVVAYKPNSIKLFLTGHGNASKEQMIRACAVRLGINVLYHDEADAIAILEMAKQGLVIGSKPNPRMNARQKRKSLLF